MIKNRIILTLAIGFLSIWTCLQGQIGPYTKVQKIPYRLQRTYISDCEHSPITSNKKAEDLWVAFSDCAGNITYADPYGRKPYSELDFMEPVFVVKTKNGYCKIIAYDPKIVKKGKGLMSGLRKSDQGARITKHKEAQYLGWVKEEYLIHSLEPAMCGHSILPIKYYTAIHHPKVLNSRHNFLKKDSLPLANEPGYRKENFAKFPLHDWVYVYKTTESPRQYLVGNAPYLDPDSLQGTFGWISDSAVLPMPINGVLICNNSSFSPDGKPLPWKGSWLSRRHSRYKKADSRINLREESLLQENDGILPVHVPLTSSFRLSNKELKTHVPFELADLNKSKVFNCTGRPVTFPTYESITQSLKRINLIFVFEDGEEGKASLKGMISSFPEIYQKTRSSSLEGYNFNWGAVGYFGRSISETFPLHHDFSQFLEFAEIQSKDTTIKKRFYEHVMIRGVLEAGRMLKGHENEHNIVIVIGSKVDPEIFDNLAQRAVPTLEKAATSLIFVQSSLDRADHYSDFILQAKQLMALTAKGVTETRKNYIVDNAYLSSKHRFKTYDRCGNGYICDFPENNMQKGGIFFPPMEEQICPDILHSVLDTILQQINVDTKRLLGDLVKGFRTASRFEQKINPRLKFFLEAQGHQQIPELVTNSINAPFFTEMFVRPEVDSFGNKAYEPAFLLQEDEFVFLTKKLRRIVLDPKTNRRGIAQISFRDRKRWYVELKRMCLQFKPYFRFSGPVDDLTLAEAVFMASGYPVQNEAFHNWTLKMIGKRTGVIPEELGRELITYYETLKRLEQIPSSPDLKTIHRGVKTYFAIPFAQLP